MKSDFDLFFLNPKENQQSKICEIFVLNGFNEIIKRENLNEKKFQKDMATIYLSMQEDYVGPFIAVFCEHISAGELCELFAACPECGSDDLQLHIPYAWRNERTDRLKKREIGLWSWGV